MTNNTHPYDPAIDLIHATGHAALTVTQRKTAAGDAAAQQAQSGRVARRAAVSDADHAVLDAEWNKSYADLRSAGLEADADHPIAAHYRDASDAVNHANRSRDYRIANPIVPPLAASSPTGVDGRY